MASLYLDHNVSLQIVAPLRSFGHVVLTARDLGRERQPDDAQLLAAVQAGHILITHNRRDFTMLHDAWLTWAAAFDVALPAHAGILVLDVAPHEVLSAAVSGILDATPATDLENGLFWWRRRDGWRRRLEGLGWEPSTSPIGGA